jgi:two-component system, sensor histidine kinase and response regulator
VKIRTQFSALLWVAAVVLPGVYGVTLYVVRDVGRNMTEMAAAEQLVKSATDLRSIAVETALFNEARAVDQWQRKVVSLKADLDHAKRVSAQEVAGILRIRGNLDAAQKAFDRIVQAGSAAGLERDAALAQRSVASLLSITSEIMDVGHDLAAIERQEASASLARIEHFVALGGAVVAAFLAFAGFLIRRQMLKPLEDFMHGTQRVAAGDYAHRLNLPQRDELGLLATSFDAMADKIQQAQAEQDTLHATLAQSYAQTQVVVRDLQFSHAQMMAVTRDNDALLSTLNQHALVSVADRLGNITAVNPAFCEISGYERSELLGQNHRLINSGVHKRAFWMAMWRSIASGQPWRGEVCNRAKDGTLFWVDTVVAPFMGDDGKIEKYISIRSNITAAKCHALELARAMAVANEASRAKSQFLATMSHELRTPMNAVLGMLMLLRKTGLTVRQADYVVKTDGAARSLLYLLNEILDFSKVEAGQMTLEPQPFSLDQLLRELSVVLAANLKSKGLDLLFDLDPRLPSHLMGDVLRLKQVLTNLCGNALKFTEHGAVVLSVSLVKEVAGVATLRWAVRDSGIGIAPENQTRVFDSFTQAEANTTRRFGGTGLGLAISQRLVVLMGGEIQLESTLGVGSCFSFEVSLPVQASEAAELPSVAQGWRVLFVDHNPSAREVYQRVGQSLGWKTEVAASLEQALAMLHAPEGGAYQTMYVDAQLPGLSLWLAAPLVRELTAEVRAVGLLNGLGSEDACVGLDAVVVKPATLSMLVEAALSMGAAQAPQMAAPVLAAVSPRPLAGLRLLVVEDNLNNQQVAQELLQDAGAQVQLADNGQLAIDALRTASELPDVVLMDLQMPVMDGLTATRLLRQDPRMAALPIVAMTANAMASDRAECLACGMNEHLAKPLDIDRLISTVLQLTGRASVPSRAAESAIPQAVLTAANTVDAAGALNRLGGNLGLYRRALGSFELTLLGLPAQLRELLAQGDLLAAAKVLHSLKGEAATLGAAALSACASGWEKTLKTAPHAPHAADTLRCLPALEAEIAQLAPELTALQQALADTEPQREPASPQALDMAALQRQLQVLAGQLKAADMAATSTMAEILAAFGAAASTVLDGAPLQALDDAVNALAFEPALVQCHALIDRYTLSTA